MKKKNLNHFKSKLFVKLFMSYLIIISLFFVAFSGFIIYNAVTEFRSKKNQEYNLKAEALAKSMDLQVLSANNIMASVNGSETIRQMYLNGVVEGKSIDSYLLYKSLGELTKMKKLGNNLDIINVIVLFNGYNKAYAGGLVVPLKENYMISGYAEPYNGITTVGELLKMKEISDILFNKESIIYGDDYHYSSSSGVVNGTILVMFNKKSLDVKLEDIVSERMGMSI
ncbi:hypothetical protein [Konateibacter massiliensis]|uniref:hypothetical protein n=1 Tax=Konateibacter massiliensis TaxID=2002841 RepID=UPI000C15E0CD|nr:hypothetical protein [Konateibacter massiliensis]